MPILNARNVINNRVEAIRSYHRNSGVTRAELDVSGGVDSAVMLGLLAEAVGPKNITAVYQGINSTTDSRNRAYEAAKAFNVALVDIDLTPHYNNLVELMKHQLAVAGFSMSEIEARIEKNPTILGSIRSTLRAPVGRGFNRLTGDGIRHGTGNEDEDRFLRFYQKGGDGEVDTNPIAMLSKGEVFQLALALGVPKSIVSARPSPDLWGVGEEHNDESEITKALGLEGTKQTMYSYVSLETGKYTSVGMIERMSRYLDLTGDILFSDDKGGSFAEVLVRGAVSFQFVGGPSENELITFFKAVKSIECATRHKLNPNCPSLGNRFDMIVTGALTNNL